MSSNVLLSVFISMQEKISHSHGDSFMEGMKGSFLPSFFLPTHHRFSKRPQRPVFYVHYLEIFFPLEQSIFNSSCDSVSPGLNPVMTGNKT